MQLRHAFLATLSAIGRFLRIVLVDLPARLLNHPLLRRLIASPLARAAWQFAIKPGLVTAPLWALAWFSGYTPVTVNAVGLTTFLAACLVLNTHAGRTVEEIVLEQISHAWRGIIFAVIPGLFRIIISAFARMLEWVEKLFYAVDEWLRFREGQSHVMLAIKAVLGLTWGVVAYAARIYLNLLVEPQINPIKHFPVVTVAAKIMLPFALSLTRIVAAPLTPFLGAADRQFHCGDHGVLHAWRVRIPRLGVAIELEALRGEPARVTRPGRGRKSRRDGRPVPPPRFPLGHAAEAIRAASAGTACRPGTGRR